MIIQIKKLMLVDAQNIVLKNGTKKVKYTFIQSDGSQVAAYDPTEETGGQYADQVINSDGRWNELQASEFRFTPKEFQGKVTLKLMPKEVIQKKK